MDPITIAALLLLGSAATAVSFAAIERWIDQNKVPNGTAEIIRQRMTNGKVMVITGIFDSQGHRLASKTWQGRRLDSVLEARFNAKGDVIRVHT
jgi:hypothetical protein